MSESIQSISQGNYILQGTVATSAGIVGDGSTQNPLRTDETVLFDDTTDIGASKIGEYILSEAAEHFERIRIYFARGQNFYGDIILEFNPNSGYYKIASLPCYDTAGTNMYIYFCSFTLSSSKFTELTGKCGYFQVINGTSIGGQVNKTSNWLHPYKIVGINRINNA